MSVNMRAGIIPDPTAAAADAGHAVPGVIPEDIALIRTISGEPAGTAHTAVPTTAQDCDRLRPARGIALGLAISTVVWVFIALSWWLLR